MGIPARVKDRVVSSLKRMVPIIVQQRDRDVSEADTVTLVKDVLADVFGYDKYTELTGELAIRGTYCDLAIKLDSKICVLIEVKAIGLALNDRHLKQAVDYASNQGIEWVILTNAATWQLHHVIFAKPIDSRLIVTLDLTTIGLKDESDLDLLYIFTKEGFKKGAHTDLKDRQDATSRFLVASLLLNNESVISVIRRELRRVVEVNVSEEEITKVLEMEVVKREVLEGPEAQEAARRVRRAGNKTLRSSDNSKVAANVENDESLA
ncbi:MAG: type I restriction enzyme HsdR N-terminal domain-containing protein, partial [Planctomycetaceae bacterium]|nr:type I restriction enzyme HsdR N-terminal domain-containing protein [Planctomycetaceae bacterium]